tara:strand:- start:1413 stop:1787 length:375 start_codon:yes stop_codon:yes gene_type:complete
MGALVSEGIEQAIKLIGRFGNFKMYFIMKNDFFSSGILMFPPFCLEIVQSRQQKMQSYVVVSLSFDSCGGSCENLQQNLNEWVRILTFCASVGGHEYLWKLSCPLSHYSIARGTENTENFPSSL